MAPNLTAVARGFWSELTGTQQFPTQAVKENLAVMDDALAIARDLRKQNPDHVRRVLLEAARLLDIDLK